MSEDDEAAARHQEEQEQQEQSMSLHAKLAEIQKALNAPKNQVNKFGGYNYRSCEDILMAVKPLLGDLSIIISDEIMLIGERYYVKATVCLTDGNGSIASSAFAREPLDKKGADASQITGAASSYARKYALNGLLLIDDAKDADATNDHGKSGVIKPTDGAMGGLTKSEQDSVRCVSDAIIAAFEAGNEYGAYEEYVSVTDNEQRIAIWSLLAKYSKIRSALKRLDAQEKAAA